MTTSMRFSKYQGIGNDFVLIADPEDEIRLTSDLVRRLCDRRFGIGGDGVIRVAPAADADLLMDYVNSDGSIGEMCGNGIRCLALFARAEGMATSDDLRVATRAGIKHVTINSNSTVTVDMGAPVFDPPSIPVDWSGPDALHAKIELFDEVIEAACVSMGNPHAVVFSDDFDSVDVADLGPRIERHTMFPRGANVEFVRVVAPDQIVMKVWERGSGQTLACGTGACAGAVAARLLRGVEPRVTVVLPGGELDISWTDSAIVSNPAAVQMTGPATKVFAGEIEFS